MPFHVTIYLIGIHDKCAEHFDCHHNYVGDVINDIYVNIQVDMCALHCSLSKATRGKI